MSMKNVTQLIGLQLVSRSLTFILNAIVVRKVGPETYGIAMVNFYLVYTTILFLSREGLRRSCARLCALGDAPSKEETRDKVRDVVNSCWLIGLPLSSIIAIVLGLFFSGAESELKDYNSGIIIFILSALLEMISEPLYILTTVLSWIKVRVYIELGAVLLRTFVTALCVLYFDQTLLAFAFGQLIYSSFIFVAYYFRDCFPRAFYSNFQIEFLKLIGGFTFQSVEKLALTEGEKFVLAGFGSNPEESGVYSLVQNLGFQTVYLIYIISGSLIARTLFQPLEESSYNEFSKLDINIEEKCEQSVKSLTTLLKTVLFVGIVFVVYGPPFSYILLDLLYGARWISTSAPNALSAYCLYILIMAVNGISEAFVFAVIPSRDLTRYNLWLFIFSLLYIVCSIVLLPFGSVGLIFANCINLSVRISYSLLFILKQFRKYPNNLTFPRSLVSFIVGVLPSKLLLLLFTVSAIVLNLLKWFFSISVSSVFIDARVSYHVAYNYLFLISIGIAFLLLSIFSFFRTERVFISDFRKIIGNTKKDIQINKND